MASYNGLEGNINTTNLDNQQILKDLEQLETTIAHLKSCPPAELSQEIRQKIHLLVTSFQVLQSRLFRTNVGSKTLDELWEGNAMLKYLFERCIQHYDVNDRLKCSSCNEWLTVSREHLKKHLESRKHIRCFSETMFRDKITFWRDNMMTYFPSSQVNHEEDEECKIDDDKCLMLKYGKFVDFDGPNDMLFCKVCCIVIPKSTDNLQNHFKQSLHQELFKEVVSVIVGKTKNNIQKTKNKNIFFDNEPDSSLLMMSCNNLHSLVNNNLESSPGTSTATNPSTDEDREEMKKWFNDTVDKFVIESLGNEIHSDKLYICSLCKLRTVSYSKWQEHCFSVIHETHMKLSNNVLYCPCSCSTEMICPYYIREYHMEKNHDRLMQLFHALKSKQVEVNPVLRQSSTASAHSDDDNVSTDDDNNNNNNFDSGVENADDLKSYLKSKLSNGGNSSIQTKIANSNNTKSEDRNTGAQPSKASNKKPAKKLTEKITPPVLNSAETSTAIGLAGIPDNTSNDDLKRVIQHFGSINKIERLKPSFANAYIELRDEFQSILNLGLTVTVKGSVVRITDPILPSTPDVAVDDVQAHKSILLKFSCEKPLMELVCDLLEKSQDASAFSNLIKDDVTHVLSCSVTIVGSKALFLATDESSTLDLFINIDDNYFGKKAEVTAVELSTRTTKLFMKLIKSDRFKNVEIVGDNVQVLKLQHKGTDKKCQIFCKDGLVVEKTSLSHVYLNCDQKIRCMALAILEWFNEVGLRDILPTYSILWMALFPLMTSFYLYPVVILRNHNEDGRKMISGWDCRYSETFSPKMKELPEIFDLVYKFFEFYSDPKNFEKKVLAPLTGEKIDQQRVRQKKLPPPFSRYCHLIGTKSVRFLKITNGICLQDPLQLNYNLTVALQGNNLYKFVTFCKQTLECFDRSKLTVANVQRLMVDH